MQFSAKMEKQLFFEGHDIFLLSGNREGVILYAPLLQKIYRIDKNLADKISNWGFEGEYNDLKYINASLKNGMKNPVKPKKSYNPCSSHLSLELTRDCSLNCVYCHAEAGKKNVMKEWLVESALKNQFEDAKKNKIEKVDISFIAGGEPSLGWDLFKYSINRIKGLRKEYNIPTYLSITTNGYYGDEKRKFISNNFDSISLSFDGPADIQNLQRPTRNNKESFGKVLTSARYYQKNAKIFGIRATITNYSVRRMPEIVEFMHKEIGENLWIVFEACFSSGRANSSGISDPDQEEYVRKYIESKELGKRLGINVISSAENLVLPIEGYCAALAMPSKMVTTEGVITACEADADGREYAYGKFSKERLNIDNNEMKEIQKIAKTLPEKCNSCFAKYNCAGDCPRIRKFDTNQCIIKRGLIQYGLEKILDGKLK